MQSGNTDLVIMVTRKNLELLKTGLPYIKRHIQADRYLCIGAEELRDAITALDCDFVNEDTIMEGLTLERVKKMLKSRDADTHRAGWYFQQFLKMAYSFYTDKEEYVVWDADTIPLKPIHYYKGDKRCFITKKEHHEPYFNAIERLFNGTVKKYDCNISFIAENMLIVSSWMREILSTIKDLHHLEDMEHVFPFIIECIDREHLFASGFSEFETYGNYIMTYHKDQYCLVRYKACRHGAQILGLHPSHKQLKWMAQYYDIVSIENRASSWKGVLLITWTSIIFRLSIIRKIISPHSAAIIVDEIAWLQSKYLLHAKERVNYDLD